MGYAKKNRGVHGGITFTESTSVTGETKPDHIIPYFIFFHRISDRTSNPH
jgi:hypothetical protein